MAVPIDLALVYDAARGWHYEEAPPGWWLDEQEALLAADERPRAALTLVTAAPEPGTACRPGSGPCRRQHEHASPSRVPA